MDGTRKPGSKPPNGTDEFEGDTFMPRTADEIRPWGDAVVLHMTWPDDPATPVEWFDETP